MRAPLKKSGAVRHDSLPEERHAVGLKKNTSWKTNKGKSTIEKRKLRGTRPAPPLGNAKHNDDGFFAKTYSGRKNRSLRNYVPEVEMRKVHLVSPLH